MYGYNKMTPGVHHIVWNKTDIKDKFCRFSLKYGTLLKKRHKSRKRTRTLFGDNCDKYDELKHLQWR